MSVSKVSIIVPTLNEEKILPELFLNLDSLEPRPFEIIFVDGPSKDETSCMIEQKGYRLIKSVGKGRALQMNEGAFQATGEFVVFLNADTRVPVRLVEIVGRTLENRRIVLGGFTSIMNGANIDRKLISFQVYLKTYLGAFIYNPVRCLGFGFRVLSGDQVLFCRKADFVKIGGFNPELPIMEDADLCIRMNKLGCVRQLKEKVYSSDRRVAKLGVISTYLRYFKIFFYWRFGASPKWLKAQYEAIR